MVLIVVFAEFSYVQQHFNPKHVPESAGSCPKQPAKRLFYKNKSPLKCKRSKINKQRPWILPLEEIQIKSPSELVISPQAHWSVTRHPHIIFFFWRGSFSIKTAIACFVSHDQGQKAGRVLPENSEEGPHFPDKERISIGLKVQKFKATFLVWAPTLLCRSEPVVENTLLVKSREKWANLAQQSFTELDLVSGW